MLMPPGAAFGGDIAWRTPEARAIGTMSLTDASSTIETLESLRGEGHQRIAVRFDHAVDSSVRESLRSSGLTLLASLGSSAYFATINENGFDAAALAAAAVWRQALPIAREMKLHRDLIDLSIDDQTGRYRTIPSWAVGHFALPGRERAEDVAALYVVFHRDVDLDEAARVVRAHGGLVVSELDTIQTLVVELPIVEIHALADLGVVQWMEPPLPPLAGVNDGNRVVVQADEVQSQPYSLDGTDVVVMLYDTGEALAAHEGFGGRLTVHDSSGLDDHSTHVAGTIGGDGTGSQDNMFRGMATNVTIENYGFEQAGGLQKGFLYTDPGDLAFDYDQAINGWHAVISNNSLGSNVAPNGFPCEWEGDYGVTSQLIDSIVRGSLGEPMRIIWAAGNERSGLALCGSSYNTTPPPAGAKNHLSVGAINSDTGSITDFTSFGPTDDGRLRPDVVAPGCQISGDQGVTSASLNGGYVVKCGTSMAAPTATGCAALLLQDYRLQFPARDDYLPSTNKALFIHNAADIEIPGPDYMSGYGTIRIKDTIDHMRTGNFLEAEVHAGQTYTFKMVVDKPVPRAVITLVWDDFPGTPNVVPALVNDLDLVSIGPGGLYRPWTLDPSAPDAPAVKTLANHTDNVEQIVIDNPAVGTYTVAVVGFDVPEGPQSFSVAVSPTIVATQIELVNDAPATVPPGRPVTVAARVIPVNDTLVEDTVTLYYRYSDSDEYTATLMSSIGNDEWVGFVPPPMCDDGLAWYITAQGMLSGFVALPSNAPTSAFTPEVAQIQTIFADDFEQDTGWSVMDGDGLSDGTWDRNVPLGGGDRGDPPTDADGSGQCYLTNSLDGNTDVDDGFTRLTSPLMDTSVGTPIIAYSRWYSNDSGASPHEDIFKVEASCNGGATWFGLETIGPGPPGVSGGWINVEFNLEYVEEFEPSDEFRIRFTASDYLGGSIIEAGVDAVELRIVDCEDVVPVCVGDFNGDGSVNTSDLLTLLGAWGGDFPNYDIAPADGDGVIDIQDLLLLLTIWGEC